MGIVARTFATILLFFCRNIVFLRKKIVFLLFSISIFIICGNKLLVFGLSFDPQQFHEIIKQHLILWLKHQPFSIMIGL